MIGQPSMQSYTIVISKKFVQSNEYKI